ncbi:MAG: UTP--glucose-1-phosphate uridylyltransferase [Clostridia bacterium]|nr:UTP--glucose-1-phosphate uridylyltransferase [Clostridia bacterium]
MGKVKKAIIPVAGYGTRFLPITKGVPKEMLPVVDRPAVQYIVEEAIAAGIEDIALIISPGKEGILKYFQKHEIYDNLKNRDRLKSVDEIMAKAKISAVVQEKMRGNGDAVLVAKDFIGNKPFAVLFGDDVIYTPSGEKTAIQQLCEAYDRTEKSIVGVKECSTELAIRCGCIVPGKRLDEKTVEMLDIIEKPSVEELPSHLASFGRFVLTPEIFEELENAPLFKDELYLTVAIRNLIKKQGGYAYTFDGRRFDLGNKFGFLQANIEYGLRNEETKDELKEYILDMAEKIKGNK